MTADERRQLAARLRGTDDFQSMVDFFKTARLNKVLLDPQAFLAASAGSALHVVADTFASLTFRHKPAEASAALLGIEWSEESADFMRDALYAEVRAEVELLRRDIAKAWLRSIAATVAPVLELDEMLKIACDAVCAEVMNS